MTAALAFKPEKARTFAKEVMERSGQNLVACYQCRRCAGACSVGEETGYITPDRLIRMILTGDQENALNNELVWKCVSCYTCGTRCPNEIQTGRITETLKKMAKEAHQAPLQPQIAHFHDAFVHSGLRWGRVNEMEFMAFYELRNMIDHVKGKKFGAIFNEIKTQSTLALSMMRLKRMHFGFLSAKGRQEIKRLYKKKKK
ncbi:MAG: 4Fe-4S dicluster domain-containing protein [Proteobacteria bacterium]|nr:4Fe-4S dicluster domain-containing protein [Pseudomonadota bacterium]